MTYKLICNQQQAWARQRGIKFDKDGYTLSLNDNLFSSLLPQVKEKFQSGKGDELGSEEKRGKMQALHSSSALVVNEPYHRHTKRTIKGKYLNVPGLWARLPRCEKLVKHIREEERGRTSFTYLDVP